MKDELNIMPLIKLIARNKRPVPHTALAPLINRYRRAVADGRPFTINDIKEVLQANKYINSHRHH
jgi:hypothetical protein